MAYNDLLSKVEAAAKSVVDDLTLSGNPTVNTGLDDDDLALPCVVCTATGTGEEVPRGTGNHVVTVRIHVKSQANDTSLATHRGNVATVFDAFQNDEIDVTLSAAVSDFHVIGVRDVRMDRTEGQQTSGQAVMGDFIELDIVACSADLS